MGVTEPPEWQPELDELEARRRSARQMGGEESVARQHDRGKLTARERIDHLLDPDTFEEVGTLAGVPTYGPDGRSLTDFRPSNVVTGRGRVDGRDVVVIADDFTIRGGAADAAVTNKAGYAEQLANEYRLPVVRLVDAAGGSVRTVEDTGRTYIPYDPGWEWVAANLATVPVVGLALGPVAGMPAARVVASHYSLMVEGISQVFVAGPPLVAQVGEQRTKEELGGPEVHARNGVVSDVVASEEEAFACTRRFLSYLPSSVHELPPTVPNDDPVDRAEERLASAVPRNPRQVYAVRPIVEAVVDRGSFFEVGRRFGRSLVTGLARFDGHAAAVVANDPRFHGGAMTADAARKLEAFVDLATTFHLPVVNFVDQPGFAIGLEHEVAGTLRAGVRALNAVYQADVPWCSVILRRCFGLAGSAHRNGARTAYRFAWPSARWGSLPLQGGVQAAYRAEIEAAPDPEAAARAIAERLDALASPFRTAEAFGVEEVIDPRTTRARLCEFARLAARVLRPGPTSWSHRG